jgi:hypothetical protein
MASARWERGNADRVWLTAELLRNGDMPSPEVVRLSGDARSNVLGAALDGWITRCEVHDTARAYAIDAEIFEGIGHNMMREPSRAAGAGRIRSWLAARGLRRMVCAARLFAG